MKKERKTLDSVQMPRHCSAGGCKSRDNRETRNAGITFHKLPKGTTRRNLWISNSHRADSWDPQTDFVYFCSKHFTPESFELTGCSGIRRLKEDAFPTVFDYSSATKCKRSGTPQKQEDIPVRKNPRSGDKNTQQQEEGQTSEEPTVHSSVAAAGETNENIPASSQETAEVEQLSQQEHSSSPPLVSRSISPSRYMRRLPPPPGFYLPKEHSYAQLCPLLWRRRYDQAIDCLEKALRQLHAARRRENRLRSTMLRLRDKRLKHTLLVSRDGSKDKGGWTSGEENRRGKGGSYQDSETDAKSEDTGLFEDRCGDQMELVGRFLPDTNSWSEEEKGYCFYCGRGQVQGGGQLARSVSKTGKDVQPTVHKDSLMIQRSVETGTCGTAENDQEIQIVRLERASGKIVETSDSNVTNSQVLLQTQVLQHVIPAAVSLSDTCEQSVQFLGSQQELLLSDMCERESEATSQQHHLDLQQQLFWIQDDAEGQVILVPVPVEDGLQSFLKMEGVADEAQTILVSELDLKGDFGLMTENTGGLSRGETGCDDEHGDQHSVINSTSVEMRDVREKLKEHLEGFHLQLSTEFIN
ncbi:THAP domain-containing protein 7 isoform X1 [Thunnus albacares]|uniref:THAP domain-containing protein 7 isoform X1 n=2 Tax=Thunnus albacares TaxID=8236 RepID=UPI001CF6B255|nr:THAP domain-containing protein 7 isoform X1 [Thunnus albacares]